ncbi:nuclear transport factor 2 family protein [Niveispirillum cyanobacteriorum]|nr:nuclear transport factor 2 family protein [Niveispirillum cyanobacteriorum]GGE88619.1 hypothetical protein GCM10011317_52070 [Niveispirillum cyanobacteriorum]
MSLGTAAQLFTVEQAARQRAACGLWIDHALHTVTLETPFARDYGRDALVTCALAGAHLLSPVDFRDVWLVSGADGHVAWSALVSGSHAGSSAAFGPASGRAVHALGGGAARLIGGRVGDLYWFDDTLALTRAAGADPQHVADALRLAEITPLGLDPAMDQRPIAGAALLPGAPGWLAAWLSVLVQKRPDQVEGLYAAPATLTLTAGRSVAGADAIARHWLALLLALPDLRLWPERFMLEGDRAALLWRLSATGPNGPVRNIPVLSMWQLEGGRIMAERLLLDEVSLLAR